MNSSSRANSEIIVDAATIPPAAQFEYSSFSRGKGKSAYININVFFTKRSIRRHTDKAAKSQKALLILKCDRSDRNHSHQEGRGNKTSREMFLAP